MAEAFGEYASATDTIAAILGTYPFSVGLFRELLQNSDDAGASKQVFVLDWRQHPRQDLFNPELADTQGPALLAYNDALFTDNDWEALQSIHRSSKKNDTSKIGKYGIGFRSCYHVTDNPQILSGSFLAILDPHHAFSTSGGAKIDIREGNYGDHLKAFDFFLSQLEAKAPFTGSVIRLPLRLPGAQSSLSSKSVSPLEIRTLLQDFIREELAIALLFLKNLKSIEIHEIQEDVSKRIASASIEQGSRRSWDAFYTSISTIKAQSGTASKTKRWRIFQSSYSQDDSVDVLSKRLCRDVRPVLEKHKLYPQLAMAVPLPLEERISGRLFTHLPLPIRTGFEMCHVHGLFALTQSRQNLANRTEVGIVKGSDDSVLIEWNQVLFDHYLPQTWASLVPVLIDEDKVTDMYDIWPPAQPVVQTGDSVYWQMLPQKVLELFVRIRAPVWPLLLASTGAFKVESTSLETVLVAPSKNSDMDAVTLMALVRAGLRIVRPPEYIFEMLQLYFSEAFTMLVPPSASHALHGPDARVGSLRAGERDSLLRFLLSSSTPEYILGLPIVPTGVEGKFVALVNRASVELDTPTYTLLKDDEFAIFGSFDSEAVIPLRSLNPSSIAELFRAEGPKQFNVDLLTSRRIEMFLRSSIWQNPFGLDFVHHMHRTALTDAAVQWLGRFWHWVYSSWPEENRSELFELIADLYLLPSRTGTLLSARKGVFFDIEATDPSLQALLQTLGIPFVHQKFPQQTQQAVRAAFPTAIKLVYQSVQDVIDTVNVSDANALLNEAQAKILLSYFARWIPPACRDWLLTEEQRKKIRALPIFPILQADPLTAPKTERRSRLLSNMLKGSPKGNISRVLGPIVDDCVIYLVPKLASLHYLPIVGGVVYLNGELMNSTLLPFISENAISASEADILSLTVQNFMAQSRGLQSAFLDYMTRRRDALPPRLLKELRSVKFVVVSDGSVQAPEHLVDPKSPLMALYLGSLDRTPKMDDESFVKQLKALGFLGASLTDEVILERIRFISAGKDSRPAASETVAIRLLDLIYSTGYDCSNVEVPLDAKWLPTTRGFSSHEECLDGGLHRPELFDLVLPLLSGDVNVSPALRKVFGWDKPLPLSTLLKQLTLAVESGDDGYRRCRALIKELSQRELTEEEIVDIKSITAEHPWIPVSGRRMAETTRAVFELPISVPGFYEIPYTLSERPEIVKFLSRMGCTPRVTAALITAELKKLAGGHLADVEHAVLLLRSLPLELNDKERAQLVVPDMEGMLRPVPEVFFNDIPGNPAMYEVEVPVAHPLLDEQTARHLRMKRLGLKSVPLNKAGTDMGVKLTTSIRNVLKQYTEQQTLTEFLANAVDAGADEFQILMDDFVAYPTSRLLTASMAAFQLTPSLVIYNNGVFTQQDWEGICRTGVGGKENRTNTIGQFGLGALSMFHFTEMATILSGDKVLFLDPSKTHLPFEDWASLLVPLSQIQRLYTDHLVPFDGLFGYGMKDTTFFSGTIFRLPLRTSAHISDRSILRSTISSKYLIDNVIRKYWTQAQQSLLFTPIRSISTLYRTLTGDHIQGWSLSADRQGTSDLYETQTVRITGLVSSLADPFTEIWEVVASTAPTAELPAEFHPLIDPHRLRSINVGLAARTTKGKSKYHAHNLFSTMPLPMLTTLPVHLSSSFILTPDRRHIRFDDYDNSESRYNRWLLSEIAPPLYLYLLERLLRLHGKNEGWWPGNTTQQDNVTRILVDSFYNKHLATSSRIFCSSFFRPDYYLPASRAILLGDETLPIAKIISMLPHPRFVRLPPTIADRATGIIQRVSPELLSDALRENARVVARLFDDNHLSIDDIQQVVRFFMNGGAVDWDGLPLLPLANGELAQYSRNDSPSAMMRYVWTPRDTSRQLFDLQHLVHPRFDVGSLVHYDLNVKDLADAPPSHLQTLIAAHIPVKDIIEDATPEQQQWINTFWVNYPQFNLQTGDIVKFPLVPTKRPGRYISLDKVLIDQSVMITSHSEKEFMDDCLERLGLIVVQKDDPSLPSALAEKLRLSPAFSFKGLLEHFKQKTINHELFLTSMDEGGLKWFAEWARGQVVTTPDNLIPAAKRLPIWAVTLPSGEIVMKSAEDVEMLPYGIPSDAVLKFSKAKIVPFYSELDHLKVKPLAITDLWNRLKIPSALEYPEDLAAYKRLLITVISYRAFIPENLLVPNGNGTMVPCSTLYAREALFISSFGETSQDKFLIENYIDLEQRLIPFGLKGLSNLDFDTFAVCAAAMDANEGGDRNKAQRAAVLFRAYAEDLPLRMNIADDDKWAQIGTYQFIPRDPMRQHSLRFTESCPYIKHLPDPVSPNEILLAELEPVCWTQRALFAMAPHARVLVAHPKLGRPSPDEVVEHLRVLALQVAKDHPGNHYVLSDLEATYRWLDDHQDEVEDCVVQHSSEPLFLNVDDPKHEEWQWHCADEMFFNSTSHGHDVRKFLRPYKDLLCVAGVDEIVHPMVPSTGDQDGQESVQAKLGKLYSGFDMMRKQGRFADVVFISADEERFPAHRTILGPMSDYLLDLFCGDFSESRPASEDNPVEIEVEYSSKCLGSVLDYLYSGAASAEMEELELPDLLDGLDISQYWGLKELNEHIQVNIIKRHLITPQTFEEISERAAELSASHLVEACEFYKTQNYETIMRLRGEGGPRMPRRLPKKEPRPMPLPVQVPSPEINLKGKKRATATVKKLMHRVTGSFSRNSFKAGSAS